MNDLIACRVCGVRHDPARSGGLCPACALDCALEADISGLADGRKVARFDGHDIIEEIARGGMGIVYRARQHRPEREVALKCLPGLASARPAARERFNEEAKAMAALDHPAILPIYHFGEQDGVPFFTMKLAGGGALSERLSSYTGRWQAIAALMCDVAEAVQCAHDRAVLHRDLKPGNLLFDEVGRPLVADFGLAHLASGADFDKAAQRSGTPAYLAPEVRNGEAFTAAADVWSLGAVLYELLAQRTVVGSAERGVRSAGCGAEKTNGVHGAKGSDGMDRVSWPHLSQVPRDLAAIAAKALAGVPAERYRSARELADDLKRWQQGRPVKARPVSWLTRQGYWAWRNPVLAGGAVVLVGALAAFSLLRWRAQRELRAALGESLLLETKHLRILDQPEQALERLLRATPLLPDASLPALRTEAAALLALPSWTPARRWDVHGEEVMGFEAFSPDLQHYVAATSNGSYTIYETATGHPLRRVQTGTDSIALRFVADHQARRVVSWHASGYVEISGISPPWSHQAPGWSQRVTPALHPDGESFVHATEESGAWLGTPAEPVGHRIAPAPASPHPVALDPAGSRVFLLQGEPRQAAIWPVLRADASSAPLILQGAVSSPSHVAWSPDGSRLALVSSTSPYSVQLFETSGGRLVREFYDYQVPIAGLAWHPDGDSFATVASDLRLVWRSVAPGGFRLARAASVRALGFSPDGKHLGFSPAEGSLGLLDLTPSPVFRQWPASGEDLGAPLLCRAVFSPDATMLAITARTHLSVRDAPTRQEIARWPLPPQAAWAEAAFLGENLYLGSNRQGLWKGSVHSLRQGKPPVRVGGEDIMLLGASPNEPALVISQTRGDHRTIWLWPDGDPVRARRLAGDFPMIGYRLIPGQPLGFTAHWSEPDLWLWDTATGTRQRSLGLATPTAGDPSPDGRWLLAATPDENTIWDTTEWRRRGSWPAVPGERAAFAAAFSPDGNMIAKALPGGLIELRSVPKGVLLLTLTPPSPCHPQQLLFHPQGRALYAVQAEGRVLEWDIQALRQALGEMELDW